MKYSFADPLKQACAAMFGIPLEDFYDDDKKEIVNEFWGFSPRQMAQLLGTEGGRQLFRNDIWIKRAEIFVNNLAPSCKVVIPDVRFENEAEFVRNNGGFIIHVKRQGVKPVSSHSSENGIWVEENDIMIENNGSLKELYYKVGEFIK